MKRRQQIVLEVLRTNPKSREDNKELLVEVWLRELNGKMFTPENIKRFCSSPSGIDRDRRRPEALKMYPRDEKKYEHFKEYRDEFSPQEHLKQAGLL